MSSEGSRSRSSSPRGGGNRSPSPKRDSKPNKLFVTNLDANGDTKKMEEQLQQLFSKHGEIASLVVKRSHNNEYCYAFIDYKEGEDATEALKRLDGVSLGNKSMKVQFQDNARRRKTKQPYFLSKSGGQCYKCGKPGHFARECRSERVDQRRGRSRSKDRKKKKSHRHRSQSSQSRHAKKKDKKKHKSHKKHKKSSKKKHYSSDSDSSD